MKLLYITNGITGSGGLERVLSVKASLLADDFNYEVHLLSLNETNKEPFFSFSKNIKIHTIEVGGNPISYFSQYKKEIQKVVNEIQPDIISVCDDGLKGFFLPKLIRTKAKWIYERHVSKLIEISSTRNSQASLQTKIKWGIMQYLAKYFKKFIVLTEGNTQEWHGLDNIVVIPNPLPFSPVESAQLDRKIIISVGRICYQKGQDLLLEAWKQVAAKNLDWQLHLYGKENITFLNTNDLPKSVHFFLPEKDLQDKYLNSSISVMSSRFEGFGMVLIEAMACGVPCISFDCNYGPSDVITHNEDGFLVDNGNTDSLANHILQLIENKELRKKMGDKAKQNVKRFDPKVIAGQWDALFKEIAK